jgi:hypothetical protein
MAWIFPNVGQIAGTTTPGGVLATCIDWLKTNGRFYQNIANCARPIELDIEAHNVLLSEAQCIVDTACQQGWTGFDSANKCNLANAIMFLSFGYPDEVDIV